MLGTFPLAYRRLRGDLVQVYKMIRGTDRVIRHILFLEDIGLSARGSFKRYMRDIVFNAAGAAYVERAVRGSGRGMYNFHI